MYCVRCCVVTEEFGAVGLHRFSRDLEQEFQLRIQHAVERKPGIVQQCDLFSACTRLLEQPRIVHSTCGLPRKETQKSHIVLCELARGQTEFGETKNTAP